MNLKRPAVASTVVLKRDALLASVRLVAHTPYVQAITVVTRHKLSRTVQTHTSTGPGDTGAAQTPIFRDFLPFVPNRHPELGIASPWKSRSSTTHSNSTHAVSEDRDGTERSRSTATIDREGAQISQCRMKRIDVDKDASSTNASNPIHCAIMLE